MKTIAIVAVLLAQSNLYGGYSYSGNPNAFAAGLSASHYGYVGSNDLETYASGVLGEWMYPMPGVAIHREYSANPAPLMIASASGTPNDLTTSGTQYLSFPSHTSITFYLDPWVAGVSLYAISAAPFRSTGLSTQPMGDPLATDGVVMEPRPDDPTNPFKKYFVGVQYNEDFLLYPKSFRVQFADGGWRVDNLRTVAVPEPSVWAFIIIVTLFRILLAVSTRLCRCGGGTCR